MANRTKLYYLCPTWDYTPDGPIQLGNIIMSTDTVAEPLNAKHGNPPPENSMFPVSVKTDVKYSEDQRRAGKYGIWTSFLSVLGVGVDLGFEHESTRGAEFTFDRIETSEFIPPMEYLEQQMAAPAVVSYLETQRFRHSVYMVTAIKTVYGVTGKTEDGKSVKVDSKLRLDGTITGIAPVSLGPEVSGAKSGSKKHSFGASSDFVFAFRLRKVKVEKSGRLVQKPETKGAMYDGDPTASKDPPSFTVMGVEEDDAELEDNGGNPLEAFDDTDGENCMCILADAGS